MKKYIFILFLLFIAYMAYRMNDSISYYATTSFQVLFTIFGVLVIMFPRDYDKIPNIVSKYVETE